MTVRNTENICANIHVNKLWNHFLQLGHHFQLKFTTSRNTFGMKLFPWLRCDHRTQGGDRISQSKSTEMEVKPWILLQSLPVLNLCAKESHFWPTLCGSSACLHPKGVRINLSSLRSVCSDIFITISYASISLRSLCKWKPCKRDCGDEDHSNSRWLSGALFSRGKPT